MSTPHASDPSDRFARVLYDRHRRDLLSYLRGRGVQDRDLEDALQEVIKVACTSRATYDDGKSLDRWLFGIAANVTRHYLRRRRRRPEELATSAGEELETIPDKTPSAEEILTWRARQRMLDDMVASVKPERRDIFVQHMREDVPLEEVARVHGIASKTAWARCKAAFVECTGWLRRWRIAEQGKGRDGEAVVLPLWSAERATARRALARQALARCAVGLFALGCMSPRTIPPTASEVRPLIVAAALRLAPVPPSQPAEHPSEDVVSPEAPSGVAPQRSALDGGSTSTFVSEVMMVRAEAEMRMGHDDDAALTLLKHGDRYREGSMTGKRNSMFHALNQPVRPAGR